MPILLLFMLLKCLMKISKLKEKGDFKSNTLKMCVGIISLLIQFVFLKGIFPLVNAHVFVKQTLVDAF